MGSNPGGVSVFGAAGDSFLDFRVLCVFARIAECVVVLSVARSYTRRVSVSARRV